MDERASGEAHLSCAVRADRTEIAVLVRYERIEELQISSCIRSSPIPPPRPGPLHHPQQSFPPGPLGTDLMEQICYLECNLLWSQGTSKSFGGDTWLRGTGLEDRPVAIEGKAQIAQARSAWNWDSRTK